MSDTASELILMYIRRNKLDVGSQLPAEIEIAKELGLSRNSIREAYVNLSVRGVIHRRHGIGTFVASPILNITRDTVGFWGLIKDAGMNPGLKEISRHQVRVPDHIAPVLRSNSRGNVWRIRWLYYANDRPCVLIDHYLPFNIPADSFDVSKRDVLHDLKDFLVVEGASLTMRTSAVRASSEVSRLLGTAKDEAVIRDIADIQSGNGDVTIVSEVWMAPGLLNRQLTVPLLPRHFLPIE